MIHQMEGILNVRDLGGLRAVDGLVVRDGLLFRGASLHKASPADLRRLSEEFHIRVDFDFRTEKEVSHAPDPHIPSVEYLWLPTIDEQSGEATNDVFTKYGFRNAEDLVMRGASHKDVQDAARTMYTSMVDNEYSQLQYAVFLQKIVALKDGAAYWHCSQGKDRTGLGAAYILGALGASREVILYDYNISSDIYSEDVRKMRQYILQNGGGEAELDVVQTFIGVNQRYFIDALDIIDQKYGGMETYIRDILMLSDDDRQILRDRYLGRSQDVGF